SGSFTTSWSVGLPTYALKSTLPAGAVAGHFREVHVQAVIRNGLFRETTNPVPSRSPPISSSSNARTIFATEDIGTFFNFSHTGSCGISGGIFEWGIVKRSAFG